MIWPSAPDGLCVSSSINALSLMVNWNSLEGASTYNLYRSTIPHDGFKLVASGITGLTYFDNPQPKTASFTLNLNNLWYYEISGVGAFGEGSRSPASTYLPYGQLVDTSMPRPGLSWWSLLIG